VSHDTLINDKDGSILELIPRGEFPFGKGQIVILLPNYYLAVYPITNKQYFEFVLDTGYPPPQGLDWKKGKYDKRRSENPVVGVSWYDAKEYCSWAGLRLPTEMEWEKGACGPKKRLFPWGNQWDEGNHVRRYMNRGKEKTATVSDYPDGCSPYGLYQMSGNILEWCDDLYDKDIDSKFRPTMVLKGGSWLREYFEFFRIDYKGGAGPSETWDNIGFRCAK